MNLRQQFFPALGSTERCFPEHGPSKPFFFESICQGGNCDPRGLTSFLGVRKPVLAISYTGSPTIIAAVSLRDKRAWRSTCSA